MEEMLDIYLRGKENKRTVASSVADTKSRGIKMLLYYFVTLIVSPYIKISDTVFYVNGSYKKFRDIGEIEGCQNIYRGYKYSTIREISSIPTFFSSMKRRQRFRVVHQALASYRKYKKRGVILSTWLEFNVLSEFMKTSHIKLILIRGHYDDVTTWIGDLSKLYGIRVVMYQHGVVSERITIPYKIRCDKINVFDNYSKNIFKNQYVDNEDCQYCIYPFKPSCLMQDKQYSTKYAIGIAEQCNFDWVNRIILLIRSMHLDCTIFVMPHPNSHYKESGDNIIVTSDKVKNMDVLITENSTLALDYYRANNKQEIIYTDDFEEYKDYPFHYCDTDEKLIKALSDALE